MSLPGYAGPWLSRCKSVRPPRPNIGIRLACAESLQVLFDNQMSSSSNGSPTLATETYAREHNPPSKAQSVVELWLRSEEHTSELQSRENLVCRRLLEKK